jgi:hypothetical protein
MFYAKFCSGKVPSRWYTFKNSVLLQNLVLLHRISHNTKNRQRSFNAQISQWLLFSRRTALPQTGYAGYELGDKRLVTTP